MIRSDKEYFGFGYEILHCTDLKADLDALISGNINFLVVPVVHPYYVRTLDCYESQLKSSEDAITRSDLIITSEEWRQRILGRLSDWIKLDSKDENIRRIGREIFKQEISLAKHLGLYATLIPFPLTEDCTCYSREIYSELQKSKMQLWITIPLSIQHKKKGDCDSTTPWVIWNNIRNYCNYHKKLGIALELVEDMPSVDELEVWFSEPIRAILVPTYVFSNTRLFLCNQKKDFITKCVEMGFQIIIKGNPFHQGCTISDYATYLNDLLDLSVRKPNDIEKICEPYKDQLEDPLQPLSENLESSIYEVFEMDSQKYEKYEEAIYEAIKDQIEIKSNFNKSPAFDEIPDNNNNNNNINININNNNNNINNNNNNINNIIINSEYDECIYIIVVGAGRGPIVESAMRASKRLNFNSKIFALEKNPNALITLKNKKKYVSEWKNVTIIDSDMRSWKSPVKFDILVSELLGSFGDNELSPECLFGVQHILNHTGVSIPQEYSSYIAPISTTKLWTELSVISEPRNAMEIPYVVLLSKYLMLSDCCKKCFTFTHPDKNFSPKRRTLLDFRIKTLANCHGFAGFFDCKLYKDVHISTLPNKSTENLFSWFPIYFPFKNPILLKKDDLLRISIERCSENNKVWYEWFPISPSPQHIHNINGRASSMNL